MKKSLLFFKEPAKNGTQSAAAKLKKAKSCNETDSPEEKLESLGYRVQVHLYTNLHGDITPMLMNCETVVLYVSASQLLVWYESIRPASNVPLFWWCGDVEMLDSHSLLNSNIDGMLCNGMSLNELKNSLLFGINNHQRRIKWLKEREQLINRIEERKWVEKAKGILCEIKNLSEPEAYEFLRKQAMRERKKMVDVAVSIVQVYRLLRDK